GARSPTLSARNEGTFGSSSGKGRVKDESYRLDAVADAEDDAPETREGTVGEAQHGERLDKVIVGLAPEFSRSHLQGLIKGAQVRVDGQAAGSAAQRVRAGQRIAMTLLPTEESRAYRAEPMPLAV